jgi:FtsP/CotA-like multicopper oxidase with cupredoxin domain
VINGKSWPYNERAHYRLGETVHMRVINASGAIHPMHMHGSFFRVDATSDGQREKVVPPEQRPMVVTQVLTQGMAMEATWQPPNPGHWLLHCHLLAHVVSSNGPPYASLSGIEAAHAGHHASHGNMVGVTMGIDVDGGTQFRPVSYRRARKLTLTLRQAPTNPEHVFTEVRERRDRAESSGLMGPPIVLRRGEPVEIAVQNRMREETAIHWHGMELESYYDGVPDFSGAGRQVTPPIQPGGKFMVRFTPPRAGTFIYHTHWHDVGQLSGGLYGPLLVVEPDKPYDRESDIAVVAGGDNSNLLINGSPQGSSMHWQAGRRYHLRFINIMVNTPVVFSLQSAAGPVHWTAVGKDGMVLPAAQRVVSESKVRIFTGETYDFEITPGPGDMVLRAFRAPLPPGLVVEKKIDIPIQVGPAVLQSESAGTRPAMAEVTSAKDKH